MKINDKELIFMEVLADFLEKEYKIDRTEALAQTCIVLDRLKEREIILK